MIVFSHFLKNSVGPILGNPKIMKRDSFANYEFVIFFKSFLNLLLNTTHIYNIINSNIVYKSIYIGYAKLQIYKYANK